VVNGQLEDSLRHEIESYIEGRLSGVKQEITELQSRLNEALNQLLDRQSEVQLDGSIATAIMEHLRAAQEAGINLAAEESARTKAASDIAIIKAAITEIDEQNSQADILNALVNRASSFAPRVAFFVIKSGRSTGWRARGFEGAVGDTAIQQISFPIDADTVIGEACRSRTTWSGGPHTHSEDHLFLNRMGEESPERIVAIPLVVRSRPVAVLYADSAGLDTDAINLEALETLVKVSSMAVEVLAARTAPAKRAAEAAPAEEAPPVEEPSSYVPDTEYDQTPASGADAAPMPVVETPAEIRSEPMPAPVLPVATSVVVETAATSFGARRRYGIDEDLPVMISSEEERRLHNDARRFARLLVSEIKMYNEQKVAEGRSQCDLYDRLREYIDRSREMYDKRVKPEVARKYDYFHHELVTRLAEGSEEKLGETYPGATVSA